MIPSPLTEPEHQYVEEEREWHSSIGPLKSKLKLSILLSLMYLNIQSLLSTNQNNRTIPIQVQ